MDLFLKKPALSLRIKLTLLIECFVIILVAVTGVTVILHEKQTLENELRKRGLAVASDLANFVVRPLMNNDLATLRRFVNNSMKQEYIRHVAILDNNGKAVMDSDLSEIGKIHDYFLNSASSITTEPIHYIDRHISDRKEIHSDIYYPITVSSLRLGFVHLGYSHYAVENQMAATGQRIFIIGLFTTAAGGFFAFFLATLISSPIRQITDATQKVAAGCLDTSLSIKRDDEIGALAGAFNRMTIDLKRTTVSKDYVDNIIGSMNDTLIVFDSNGIIKSANSAACGLLEYDEKELVGKEIHYIIAQENQLFHCRVFSGVPEAKAVVNQELNYITKSRKQIPMLFSASILKNKEGALEGAVCIARDMTVWKQAEKALQESEHKYRTLFEESKDVVCISTPAGKFLDINSAGMELFGYSTKEELLQIDIGRDLYDIPAQRELFQQIISAKGFVKDYEVTFKRKDGKKVIVLLTSSAVYDDKGKITAYHGIMKDITQWKSLELQLHQAQKMEAIGTLAGGIAHDFNNILTVIIGYGTLLQQMNQDETLTPYLKMIIDAAQNTANLTRSLLAFSRRQIMTPKPVNLNNCIQGIAKMLSRIIREDIALSLSLIEKDLIVMADTGQIEQVMINLATNARDAMPDGGNLNIRTDFATFDSRFVKTHGFGKPGTYAMISVTDSGHGMDEETRARLFEPFYTTKEVGKGTGLGLSMVYGIIKQHEGYINVSSELGTGTVFEIYLPLIKSKDESIKQETAPFLKGGSETILIIEDNGPVRTMIKNILTKFGYKIIEAEDGEDGLRVFRENSEGIHLVILDVIMPKKNGKEVYMAIKNLNPHIKVIFISGYDARIIAEKGVLQEDIHFISKPVFPQELLEKIREVLDRRELG